MSLNAVHIMGRFVKKPELKEAPGTGLSVTRFTLAVDRMKALKDADKKTDFVDCQAWGNTAEFVCKYFDKGSPIVIEGRVQTSVYDDKDGIKRKAVVINVRRVEFCLAPPKRDADKQPDSTEIPPDDDLPF